MSLPDRSRDCRVNSSWDSSLNHRDGNLPVLSKQTNTDISHLHSSISFLENQADTLTKVVLQNHHGLDLLFFREEAGLCMAVGETHGFYANHSGVIKETLTKVKENLLIREQSRKQSSDWYESLFYWSSWLTTLFMSNRFPIPPVPCLLFAPCIINAIACFVQDQTGVVKLMILRAQYNIYSSP